MVKRPSMIRRWLPFVGMLVVFTSPGPVFAQSDTGEIDIVVQQATSKAPVVLARVLLDGPVITSEFTGDNGKVRFTDVPDGIYRARVFARGFQAVTSENFEVTNGRVVTITVALALSKAGNLRTIASVVAKSTATVSTNAIDQNSAQRKLSDSLADALGKLSGVTVATSSNDTDATQTVSLEGQDASQTALTLDGIPLNAPGTPGDLRGIGTDLFTRSSVSLGPQLGGLAGGVGFSSLQPTLSWQSQFSLSVGSNGKNNYSFGESGTVGKFGLAVMHSYRFMPSLLDGMQFLDTSGLYYAHEGDGQQIGSMLKVRYQADQAQTLTGMFMHNVNGSELVCAQITGPLPCGYGPNNSFANDFKLYSLTDNALIGDTQLQGSVYGMRIGSTRDELQRFVNGEAQPTGTSAVTANSGISLNATLPSRDRHTISVNGYATQSQSTFTPLVSAAQPFVFPGQRTSYAAITLNDSIRANTKLRFNDAIGLSHASNAASSLLLGLGAQWNPTSQDSYAFAYNIGGVAPHVGRFGLLSDPAQLRFNCNGDVAYGNAPGDQPGSSSSTSTRVSYTHKGRTGLVSASLYRQVQRGIVLPTQVNGSVLLSSGIFPPNYFSDVQNDFTDFCGMPISFGPANVYFSTPIGGVERVYEGAHISAYYTLGELVVQPYYDVQVAKAVSGDVRLNNPYSITISGSQLPNVPLHRAGVTLDLKAPGSAIEWLADAQYTSANNPQNLPAYTTVDAGVNLHVSRGDLTFSAANIFNTYGGAFSSSQWAVPYTTLGGTIIPTIARPNAPRQYSVTYTVRFGSGVPQAPSRGPMALGEINEGERQGPGGRGGFRQFAQPLPDTPPADPFAMNASAMCTADAQKSAKPMVDGLKAYVARVEALKTSGGFPANAPAANIPGLNVQYHGLGSTYALTVSTTQTAQLRSLFACMQLHAADESTAQQRKLYLPPTQGGMFFRPSVSFMPSVGLYFVRRPPQPGTESFRLYKLPSSPPKDPFMLRSVSSTCTAPMHVAAQSALTQLRAHFATDAPAPAWTVTAHSAKAGTWYSLEPTDVSTVPAVLNCGHVAAANRDDLSRLGWDAQRPPTINYTPSLGLYVMMFRGPAPGASPGASPTPQTP
jgi:Carboxypeptidase regulatory-like domain/TonB-dependent Receptor Plug Domain